MKREIIVQGDIAIIPLTKGYFATIDAADAHLVAGYSWHAHTGRCTTYAMRWERCADGKRRGVLLHRALFALADPDVHVDHRDKNGLNNRRANLRSCSNAENLRNRGFQRNNVSGFKGVSWHAKGKKWQASIRVSGSQKHLGLFESAELAHAAYIAAATAMHGEFARVA